MLGDNNLPDDSVLQWIIEQSAIQRNRSVQALSERSNGLTNRTAHRRTEPTQCSIDWIIEHMDNVKQSTFGDEPIPFAFDVNIDLLNMRQHCGEERVSLASVAVLNEIKSCVMNSAMRTQLDLDYDATAEPVTYIGRSSRCSYLPMPSTGYRILESVSLHHASSPACFAVVNPIFVENMEFDFILGTDYLAQIGIDWPRDVKKMRVLDKNMRTDPAFSQDSDSWPITIGRTGYLLEVAPPMLYRSRHYG